MPVSEETVAIGRQQLRGSSPAEVRRAFRSVTEEMPTSGFCPGFVQANLAIVPSAFADDFEAMCEANPQPLPLIERLPKGDPRPRFCAEGADLRTDLSEFMVFRGGAWSKASDLLDEWNDDAVAFVIGCSFSAEKALSDNGVHLKQMDGSGGVPVYRSTVELEGHGDLRGHMVVSMRSIRDAEIDRAVTATSSLPVAHGGPVLIGDGAEIGVKNGSDPDWGWELEVAEDETPMFFACGVTPQAIIEESNLPWAFVHSPGCMFITDIPDELAKGKSLPELRKALKQRNRLK